MATISSIYVNGVKKFFESPRTLGPSQGVKWAKVRLRDQPQGPVVSEHTVPAELFDPEARGRWLTGGNWYSQLPDSAFAQPVAA